MPAVIKLQSNGGSKTTVDLGNVVISILVKYNYRAECWEMDVYDSLGELLSAGLMLVPGVDLLKPYPVLKQSLGSFVVFEKYADAYKSTEGLGTDVKLVWFSPGEAVVLS